LDALELAGRGGAFVMEGKARDSDEFAQRREAAKLKMVSFALRAFA
jgi:hypothetical protein